MALFKTFGKEWAWIASIAIVCECTGIYYSIFITYLAEYIRDETMHYTRGIWLIVLYIFMNLFVIILRNRYIQLGYVTAIRMRRTLVAIMFDKVSLHSVESL